MNLKILDSKVIQHRTWYLCKGDLLEYLKELKNDFYEYAIQRKIVKNQYLDHLYSTVKIGDPIPNITLMSTVPLTTSGDQTMLDLEHVEILDGLQRTFRLWAYRIIAEKYQEVPEISYRDFARHIKDTNPLFYDSGVVNATLIKNMIESNELNVIENTFSGYQLYFTIWTGLEPKEVINKMLVLNAGQKAVSKTHQFELLFLHFYNTIKENETIKIKMIREKDSNANKVKKGDREIGEFLFSSIIVALQSFIEKKPLRVSTDQLIIESDEYETEETLYDTVFSQSFLEFFLKELYSLDEQISTSTDGKEWFVKDTTLSGIFAAVGKKVLFDTLLTEEELRSRTERIFHALGENIQNDKFNLHEYKHEYNIFSNKSVNIGSFIRNVIMEYTLALLEEDNPTWKSIFDKLLEKKR